MTLRRCLEGARRPGRRAHLLLNVFVVAPMCLLTFWLCLTAWGRWATPSLPHDVVPVLPYAGYCPMLGVSRWRQAVSSSSRPNCRGLPHGGHGYSSRLLDSQRPVTAPPAQAAYSHPAPMVTMSVAYSTAPTAREPRNRESPIRLYMLGKLSRAVPMDKHEGTP